MPLICSDGDDALGAVLMPIQLHMQCMQCHAAAAAAMDDWTGGQGCDSLVLSCAVCALLSCVRSWAASP
jgi:hypothetical protein